MAPSKDNFVITVLVALAAVCLPYGCLIGIAAGTALYYLQEKRIVGRPTGLDAVVRIEIEEMTGKEDLGR